MNIFKGKLQRLNGFSGKIKKKLSGLTVEITPLNAFSKVTIKKEKPFSGRWYDKTRFSGSVSRIPAIYRFLKAWSKFFSKYEAKATTAPAKLIEIDTAFVDETDVKPSAHEAKCVTVDQKTRFSVFADLNGYKLALLKFIKGIRMKNDVFLIAADGRLAKYRKALKLNRKSKAEAADSAIIESRLNKVKNGVIAPAITGEAECIQFTEEMPNGKTATVETADTIGVNVSRAMVHSYKAAPFTWFLSEYTDGTLHIFQAVSGVQTGNSVEIDTESESVYWANALVRDGVANLVFAQTEPQTSGELELI